MQNNSKNPFQGVTLQAILEYLVEKYGYDELCQIIRINCFYENPSIKSSLKFLRRTKWAREKVEQLYLDTIELDKQDEVRRSVNS